MNSTDFDPPTGVTNGAVLISVGGSPAPILKSLRSERAAHVWYFCSAGTRGVAEEIHAQLDWHPKPRFIEVERYEELGPCYSELRSWIPQILRETRVAAADVRVDYTGGTKTMSAALVLAATELFSRFSYVGSLQREGDGLGVTVDGKERMLYQANPWSELAVRELERARDFWDALNFRAAEDMLRKIALLSGRKLPTALADVAQGLAARHRLDFKDASRCLSSVRRKLDLLLDSAPRHPLPEVVSAMVSLCDKCAPEKEAGPELLRELLDNALRTAGQHRYDDAAARLYRAMEMQGQLWLTEGTDGLFVNGRCVAARAIEIPPALAALECCRPDAEGEVKLSLEQCFRAVHALGDGRVTAVMADLAVAGQGRGASRWRNATRERNEGILAHGVKPVDEKGFERMKHTAAEFLGFDLSQEAHPLPRLDLAWLQ